MTYENKPRTVIKIVIETYISIITLNVNGSNAPMKRQRLAEWRRRDALMKKYCGNYEKNKIKRGGES